MKQYGISTIAKLFGISAEAIRKYEKAGLIPSRRNEESGNREYDVWDFGAMVCLRRSIKFGLGMPEVSQIAATDEPIALTETIERARDDIERQIERFRLVRDRLTEWEREVGEATFDDAAYRFEYRPEVVLQPTYLDGDASSELSDDREDLEASARFLKELPVSFLGGCYRKDGTARKKHVSEFGVCMLRTDMDRLGVEPSSRATFIKPAICLATYKTGSAQQPLNYSMFEPMLGLIEARGYRLEGDIFVKVVFASNVDGEQRFFHKVWFPVEKK